jgi:Protein of unknown function (DUF2924)
VPALSLENSCEVGAVLSFASSTRARARASPYWLQAERLDDLDVESRRLLDGPGPPEDAGKRAVDLNRPTAELRPGTMMARQWNGRMHRVAVLADGFAWNGKTYPSLSKIALAITGTRWNGPRFAKCLPTMREKNFFGNAPIACSGRLELT